MEHEMFSSCDHDDHVRPAKRLRLKETQSCRNSSVEHESCATSSSLPITVGVSPTASDSSQGEVACIPDGTIDKCQSDEQVCMGMLDGGMLHIARLARETLPPERHPVVLKHFENGIAIYDTTGSQYLGLLHHDIGSKLAEILSTSKLAAEAYLCLWQPEHKGDEQTSRKIHILLYTGAETSRTIGDKLASSGLYLQHPLMGNELNAPYYNPQYLCDPQAPFPSLDDFWQKLALEEDQSSSWKELNAAGTDKTLFSYAQGPRQWKVQDQSSRLKSTLHDHQLKALAMMLEKERGLHDDPDFPPLWKKTSQISSNRALYKNTVNGLSQENPYVSLGGLLADDMGLGKTLTTVALVAASLDDLQGIAGDMDESFSTNMDSFGISKTLIVTPKATIGNWENEFRIHTKPGSIKLCVYRGRARGKLIRILQESDVVLTTYGILEKDSNQSLKLEQNISCLFSTQWFRVVYDEAHVLRNNKTKIFEAASGLLTERTWCLSGTPIQNCVEDLGALLQILKVAPFDNPGTFAYEFGQLDKKSDEHSLIKLRRLISAICLRRTKEILNLPTRTDISEEISLDQSEQGLYNAFSSRLMTSIDEVLNTGIKPNTYANVMKQILRLRQICDHGADLLPPELLLTTHYDHKIVETTLATCELCAAIIPSKLIEFDCMHLVCNDCVSRITREQPEVNDSCPMCCSLTSGVVHILEKPQLHTMTSRKYFQALRPSSKVSRLLRNLMFENLSSKGCMKSVVFSEWTSMLDLVGLSLKAREITFTRIDGQMKSSAWKTSFETFAQNPHCSALLASLRNAGVGIDLRVATSVHLLEPQWNPMVEEQAFDRVHRLGQKHPVRMYRYAVKDSIEEYVQQKKQHKLELIRASLDAHQDNKKVTTKDKLLELKQFFHIKSQHTDSKERIPNMSS